MKRYIGIKKKTVTVTANGPDQLLSDSDTSRNVFKFEVYAPSGNAGALYIGNDDVDSTWIPLSAGAVKVFQISDISSGGNNLNCNFDLSKWFITGTNGDTAIIQYLCLEYEN